MRITFTVSNLGSRTIYDALKEKLGREPKHSELVADVARILRDGRDPQAGAYSAPPTHGKIQRA